MPMRSVMSFEERGEIRDEGVGTWSGLSRPDVVFENKLIPKRIEESHLEELISSREESGDDGDLELPEAFDERLVLDFLLMRRRIKLGSIHEQRKFNKIELTSLCFHP